MKKSKEIIQKKMNGKYLIKVIEQLLLMFCLPKKKNYILPVFSKHKSNREKQVILLMISIGERCHYLALKKLSAYRKI